MLRCAGCQLHSVWCLRPWTHYRTRPTQSHRRRHGAQCCAVGGSFPSTGESVMDGGGNSVSRETASLCRLAIMTSRGGTPSTGESAPDGGANSVLRETAPLRRLAIMTGRSDTPLTGESAPDDGGNSISRESVHQHGRQLLLCP